jgi:Uma2 family endonuclease
MLRRDARPGYSRAEFLEWEASQEQRHEFVGGVIKAMAGGSVDHNRIAGNIHAALHARLAGGPCEAFQQNMRLSPRENEDATYPDVLVICDRLEGGEPSVETATVVVEVTSPSSEKDDIVRKWQGYQHIRGLRQYVIVDQGKVDVQVFGRAGPEEAWVYRRIGDLAAALDLPSLGATLTLDEIHARTRAAALRPAG